MTAIGTVTNVTDTLDTVYEYENEGDLIPSRIIHVLSQQPKNRLEKSNGLKTCGSGGNRTPSNLI